jgi:hypothetical protein
VLAELAACAGTMCKQAWVDNFSKVTKSFCILPTHCTTNHTPAKQNLKSWGREPSLLSTVLCTSSTCPVLPLHAALPSQVLLAGLSAAQHSSESIRELAFLLVLALARHQAELFEPVLDVVLQPLLQGCADESREVRSRGMQSSGHITQPNIDADA